MLRRRAAVVKTVGGGRRHDNTAVAHLFQSLGFVPWAVETTEALHPSEVYLRLPDAR